MFAARRAQRLMIDFSHANSSKQYEKQVEVGRDDGVHFLMTGDVIRTATISSTTSVNFTNITTRGLRLVASDARVRQLYGRPFFVARDGDGAGSTLLYRPKPADA